MKDDIRLFTSESVSIGHPDKMADQISDAILDEVLRQDPHGRVACETFLKGSLAAVGGEISANARLNVPEIVREEIKNIGYTKPEYGFDLQSNILVSLTEQSGDIAEGVDEDESDEALGAGDMGLMFGYACKETPELMPLPLMLSRGLTDRLTEVRREEIVSFLRPDGKAQVTVEYDDQNRPERVETVVVAAQHEPDVDRETLEQELTEHVVEDVIDPELLDDDTNIYINPTGVFVKGGPEADTGLTGRKVIVDTYGGMGNHGGGCFSGKDPTKVDRSAAYAARHAAKNIVAADLADRCEVQLSYAIGKTHPVSINVECFGTASAPAPKLVDALEAEFDFSPGGIIDRLELRRPIYLQTTRDGHFGSEKDIYPWENTEAAERLRSHIEDQVAAEV